MFHPSRTAQNSPKAHQPQQREQSTTGSSTTLAFSRSDRFLVLAIGAAVGMALGLAIPWLARLPWVPYHDVVAWLGSFESTWLTILRPVAGLLVGAALAVLVIRMSVSATVTDSAVQVRKRGRLRVIDRADVAGVYRDGGKTVLENASGRRLLHENLEGGRRRVAEAFVRHGYPWEDR